MNTEAIAIIPLLQETAPLQPEQTPAEPHATLIQKLGELPTKAAAYLDIKTAAACNAVADTLHTAKDYLKHQGGRLAAHTYLAALAVTGGGLGAFLKTNTAHAEAQGPRYTVTQAAKGGILSRTTPNWEDTPHIIGQGIYPNDVLTLKCGVTDGSPVGQYNNTTWYFVHNNSRNEPDFWANDHYLDTPNTAGHIAPDVTVCPNKGPNPMEGQTNSTTTTAVTSVFFSPIPGRANGLDGLAMIADKSYALEEWTSNTKCSNDKVMQIIPESANTLAGWSVGRLGLIYYLAGATKE
ncbi:MAG TPA: hypothetical protein VFT53_06975 [Candidatus Saccharimonadales bacterium]|nr:hypothetical protein [Candidatus Saccharimonadales bacterium]